MYVFTTRCLSGILCLLVAASPIFSQQLTQLTEGESPGRSNTPTVYYKSFGGNLYTANRNDEGTSRFAILDTVSGQLIPVTDDSEFLLGAPLTFLELGFQEIDGMLFGYNRTLTQGYEIFRIEGQTATKITTVTGNILTEMVKLGEEYYFLSAGRILPFRSGLRSRERFLELWKTDGTAAGTQLVEELLSFGAEFFSRQVSLTAGDSSLLIGGAQLFSFTASDFVAYRPGEETKFVGVQQDFNFDQIGLESFDRQSELSIVYTNGAYYVGGKQSTFDDTTDGVYRVAEETLTFEFFNIASFPSLSGLISDIENVSLQAVEDTTYAFFSGGTSGGYALYKFDAETGQPWQLIAGGSGEVPSVYLAANAGKLYFPAADANTGKLLTYTPATQTIDTLVSFAADFSHRVVVNAGSVYLIPTTTFSDALYRYHPDASGLDTINNADLLGVRRISDHDNRYTFLGEDLIYNGLVVDSERGESSQPFVWRAQREQPELIGNLGLDRATGVITFLGVNSREEILYRRNSGSEILITRPEQDTVSVLQFPNTDEFSFTYQGVANGEHLYFQANTTTDSTTIAVVRGEELIVLTDAATGMPVQLSGRAPHFNNGRIYDSVPLGDSTRIDAYTIEGTRARRGAIATINQDDVTLQTSGENLAVFSRDDEDNIVFDLYDGQDEFIYTSAPFAPTADLFSYNSTGYFLAVVDLENEIIRLEYYGGGTDEPVVFPLADSTLFDSQRNNFQIEDRLLFVPFSRAFGNELHVADAGTQTIGLLKDINPGRENSYTYIDALLNGILYFSANDGETGTEPWRTDGTTAGTYQLADINPGPDFSGPFDYTVIDSTLYFSARGTSGRELYTMPLDGSGEVELLVDVNPGTGDGNPYGFQAFGDSLYFAATPGDARGYQIFRYAPETTSLTPLPFYPVAPTVFPNPTGGAATIVAPSGQRFASLTVFDGTGRQVKQVITTGQRYGLQLGDLPAGTYFLLAQYASGEFGRSTLSLVR